MEESGYGTEFTRVPYGDSAVRSTIKIENAYGHLDSALYRVWAKAIYVGSSFELLFVERNGYYSFDYCNLLRANTRIDSDFGALSKETNINEVLDISPNSAKWLNDITYYPMLVFADFPSIEWESLLLKDMQWIPFSDGQRGTVHLFFYRRKLIIIKRNWGDY